MGFTNDKGYLHLAEPGYVTTCGYYSESCWVNEDRLVVTRYRALPDETFTGGCDLVLADTAARTEKILYHADGVRDVAHIVFGTTLYYVEDKTLLCSLDVDSGERREIHRSGDPIDFPHMTADGRYMNWFFKNAAGKWTCRRIDLATGEVVTMLEKAFAEPFSVANHMMICPADPDLLFFAHEGDTRYITNRLWVARMGEEPYNVAPQRLGPNGDLIDCFGHESWAPDGKGLWFVKYAVSPSEPKGVCYVDVKTRESKVLYTKYRYWHCCAAPDGRHVTADTGPSCDCDVVVIDTYTGEEKIAAHVRGTPNHPGHPHPQFSPKSAKICFHDVVEDNTLGVGILPV